MKKIILSLSLCIVLGYAFGQTTDASDFCSNDKIKIAIDSMVRLDQLYRQEMAWSELDKKKIDSLNNMSRKKQLSYFIKKDNNAIKYDKVAIDSVINLQNNIDYNNRKLLREITLLCGWPNKKEVKNNRADLLLYHVPDDWIIEMFPKLKEEVLKGNMKPLTLANIYDKMLNRNNKDMLYHTLLFIDDDNKVTYSSPKELEKTNNARVEIGLKPIRLKKNGKRKR